jgi:anaerobic magnesium-protoporphyrin IX monomethyl ester cyclase
MILTPFPGTPLYAEAEANGWLMDRNWSHYDMIHAIMPTETLNPKDVQEELFNCYRSFFGKYGRRIEGIFSSNKFKRETYRYMVSQGLVRQLQNLI